jgi:acetoin utilization deacetylase AcuC-like enzyme
MADLRLTSGDFAQLASTVSDYAPQPGRLVMFLEGGYDLGALRSSIHASLSTALGQSYDGESPSSGGPGTEQIERMRQARRSTIEQLNVSDDEESTR